MKESWREACLEELKRGGKRFLEVVLSEDELDNLFGEFKMLSGQAALPWSRGGQSNAAGDQVLRLDDLIEWVIESPSHATSKLQV